MLLRLTSCGVLLPRFPLGKRRIDFRDEDGRKVIIVRRECMQISLAANTMAPAYLAILSKGFVVTTSGDMMVAEKGQHRFVAEEPVSLLGLIALAEVRGEEWQASDDEIAAFLRNFG